MKIYQIAKMIFNQSNYILSRFITKKKENILCTKPFMQFETQNYRQKRERDKGIIVNFTNYTLI